MKIIDWECKGNVVRFYLGVDNCTDYWGDDWDDAPYESNAGRVYSEYITGREDVAFEFGDIVVEPEYGYLNSPWAKEDMKNREVPCLVVIKEKDIPENFWRYRTFADIVAGYPKAIKYYFGDKI